MLAHSRRRNQTRIIPATDYSDRLLDRSRRFAGNLADRLRDRIYENVVPQLAAAIARARKLIVPTALEPVAIRLTKTELRPGTADNDINALKSNGSIPEGYTVNHFLTDTDAWFLTTDVPNGLKHFVRTPLQNSMDGDFDTGNVRYKARERYSFGWSDPLGMWGSSGSS